MQNGIGGQDPHLSELTKPLWNILKSKGKNFQS
jgi:hypothetical protein